MSIKEHTTYAAENAARAALALARAIFSGGLTAREGIKTLDALRASAQNLGVDSASMAAHLALRAVETLSEKTDIDLSNAYLSAAERALASMD